MFLLSFLDNKNIDGDLFQFKEFTFCFTYLSLAKNMMSAIPPTPCKKRSRPRVITEPTIEEWLSSAGLSILGEVNGITVFYTPMDLLGLWDNCPSTEWPLCYTCRDDDKGLPEYLQVESNIIVLRGVDLD